MCGQRGWGHTEAGDRDAGLVWTDLRGTSSWEEKSRTILGFQQEGSCQET